MKYIYLNVIRFSFISILLLLIVTGCCYTRNSLKKIDPPAKISKFESVWLSERNEFIFNFRVRLTEENNKEEVWCAKLIAEKAYEHSIMIDKPLPQMFRQYHQNLESSLKNMHAMSDSNYSISQSECIGENTIVPCLGWKGDLSYELKHLDLQFSPKIMFIYNPSDYGYIIDSRESAEHYRITKIELPLPYKVYNKDKIALLPLYIVFDILTFPIQFVIICIFALLGPM